MLLARAVAGPPIRFKPQQRRQHSKGSGSDEGRTPRRGRVVDRHHHCRAKTYANGEGHQRRSADAADPVAR